MHDRNWFGMDGMGSSYWIPILVVIIVILVWGISRGRSRRDR